VQHRVHQRFRQAWGVRWLADEGDGIVGRLKTSIGQNHRRQVALVGLSAPTLLRALESLFYGTLQIHRMAGFGFVDPLQSMQQQFLW